MWTTSRPGARSGWPASAPPSACSRRSVTRCTGRRCSPSWTLGRATRTPSGRRRCRAWWSSWTSTVGSTAANGWWRGCARWTRWWSSGRAGPWRACRGTSGISTRCTASTTAPAQRPPCPWSSEKSAESVCLSGRALFPVLQKFVPPIRCWERPKDAVPKGWKALLGDRRCCHDRGDEGHRPPQGG